MSSLREECGVFGVFSPSTSDVAHTTYYGLFALQHRGQESCGIVVNDDGVFASFKDTGLVNDVFTPDIIARLGEGNMAVGHVRYGTTGSNDRNNAQPMVINHGVSLSLKARFSIPQAIPRLFPTLSQRNVSPPRLSNKQSIRR